MMAQRLAQRLVNLKMVKSCVDCGDDFAAPHHGHGTMVRCRTCQSENQRLTRGRALRSNLGRWTSARLAALRRGLPFELTRDDLATLLVSDCTYCGNPLNETGAGLDRLNDADGYFMQNVVACCWPCNNLRQRGDFSFEEMMQLGPLLGPIWKKHPPRGTRGGRRRNA